MAASNLKAVEIAQFNILGPNFGSFRTKPAA